MRSLPCIAALAALMAAALLASACQGGEEAPAPSPTPQASPTPLVSPTPLPSPVTEARISIQYFGHSMFKIISPAGTVILTDPNEGIGYRKPDGPIDVVTVSHNHFDHDQVDIAEGARVLRGLTEDGDWATIDETIGDARIGTIPTYHDDSQGSQRGKNSMFLLEMAGLRILHAGDLGHRLTDEQLEAVGEVDILLIPVGGHFTIGPQEATAVVEQLNPRIALPMHYRSDALAQDFKDREKLATLDEFVAGKENVQSAPGSSISFSVEALPPPGFIVTLAVQPE